MVLTEKEFNYKKVEKLIGQPIKFKLNNKKPIGSCSFFIVNYRLDNEEELKLNSKWSFQQYEKGFLLSSNFSNTTSFIPVRYKDILNLRIIRGKESIKPFLLTPFWFMLKIGVPVRYARYFGLYYLGEYSIDPMKISLKTTSFEITLTQNGYKFESQKKFFNELELDNRLQIII